jgi:hypothetical protein
MSALGQRFQAAVGRLLAANCPIRFPRPAVRLGPPRMGNIEPWDARGERPVSGTASGASRPYSVVPVRAQVSWKPPFTIGRSTLGG